MDERIGTTAQGEPPRRRLSLVVSEPLAASKRVTAQSLRLMILDRDRQLVEAVGARGGRRGWEIHVLSRPTTRRLLARMRIDVLLVDPAVIDSEPWSWLEGMASGLPGMALVVCSGPSTVQERVRALQFGVDDWLGKPAHPDEVIARVERAVLRRRRVERTVDSGAVRAGEIEIRSEDRQAFVAGVSAALTPREFDVLRVLAASEGAVVERGEIFSRVWGYAIVPGDRSVDVHVRKIRGKLARVSPTWSYIHTQFRIGYRFQPERV
jgi:DNA-binding response OmpR family regulator